MRELFIGGVVVWSLGCGARSTRGSGSDGIGSDGDADADDPDGGDACASGASHAEGCSCDSATEPEACYPGPDGTLGIGRCVGGLRACRSGRWTACEGATLPAEEECNDVDDDCDGEEDDGLAGACGDCHASGCPCVGIGCPEPFAPDDATATGVIEDDDGSLTLEPDAATGEWTHVFWAECTTGWYALAWDADIPPGASLTISVRLPHADRPIRDWTEVATDPPDVPPAEIRGNYELEVRIELRAAEDGASPVLRSVTGYHGYWSCTLG